MPPVAADLSMLPEVTPPEMDWEAFWPAFWAKAAPLLPENILAMPLPERNAVWKQLYERFFQVNAAINLTRIVDANAFFIRHVLDSWTVLPHLPQKAKLLDVGTGGGFPALPIAWARPDITVVANDSVAKKLACVQDFAGVLGASNLQVLHGRTEALAHAAAHRETYDGVLARGVAALPTLVELTLPLIKPGGTLWAFKTQSAANEELVLASKAIKTLGGKRSEIHTTEPHADEPLVIVAITKTNPSPKQYPRGKNLPRKSPLL